METGTFLLYAATALAACMTPGPAVLLVVSTAIARGAAASMWATLGIIVANTIYFILAGTGAGALLLASYDLFAIVRWVGAAYVLYLGIRSLLAKPQPRHVESDARFTHRGWQALRDGAVLQLTNPSALVFFAALLPQFIDPGRPIVTQVVILMATGNALELLVLGLYGALADRAARAAEGTSLARWTNRVSGVLLIGAALALALSALG